MGNCALTNVIASLTSRRLSSNSVTVSSTTGPGDKRCTIFSGFYGTTPGRRGICYRGTHQAASPFRGKPLVSEHRVSEVDRSATRLGIDFDLPPRERAWQQTHPPYRFATEAVISHRSSQPVAGDQAADRRLWCQCRRGHCRQRSCRIRVGAKHHGVGVAPGQKVHPFHRRFV